MPIPIRPILAALLLGGPTLRAQPHAQPQPVPLPDYVQEYNDFARSLQRDGADGWDLLMRIAELHREIAERHYDEAFDGQDSGYVDYELAWDPDSLDDEYTIELQLPRIRAQIEDARESGMLDMLAQLATTDRLTMPRSEEPLLILTLPHLGSARFITRLNGARMTLPGAADDEIAAAFAESVWLSRSVPRSSPLLIGDLVGAAIESLTLARVRNALLAGRIDPALATRLLATLDDAPPPLGMADVLKAERFLRLDTYNRLYTDDGAGDGLLVSYRLGILDGEITTPSRLTAPATGQGGPRFATKKQVLARDAEVQTSLDAIALGTPQERAGLVDEFEQGFRHDSSLSRTFTSRGKADLLVHLLYPAMEKAGLVHDQIAIERAATRVMLAIEVYRGREGRPPARLADLTPDILPELPTDPFTGEPPLYSPDPAAPLGYTLYSAGFDQTDDHGTPYDDPEYPLGALREMGEGSDYLFVPSATVHD